MVNTVISVVKLLKLFHSAKHRAHIYHSFAGIYTYIIRNYS